MSDSNESDPPKFTPAEKKRMVRGALVLITPFVAFALVSGWITEDLIVWGLAIFIGIYCGERLYQQRRAVHYTEHEVQEIKRMLEEMQNEKNEKKGKAAEPKDE